MSALSDLSTKELKRRCREQGLDTRSCLEKSDLAHLLQQHASETSEGFALRNRDWLQRTLLSFEPHAKTKHDPAPRPFHDPATRLLVQHQQHQALHRLHGDTVPKVIPQCLRCAQAEPLAAPERKSRLTAFFACLRADSTSREDDMSTLVQTITVDSTSLFLQPSSSHCS